MNAIFFALENGKHFYVYSLKNFKLLKRVTLPRTYEAIDVCGFYSDDGKVLNIPAERYVYDDKDAELGHFEYILCRYETDNYSMIEKVKIADKTPYLWQSIKEWTVKKAYDFSSNRIDPGPQSYGLRSGINGFSHGLKTCPRHVFLTAFRIPLR